MEILFDCNHLIIDDIYTFISIYKIKYNSNNKLPDDTYKSLKSAIKLEKEIGNTTKTIIEEIEKENVINSNTKQLESVCESIKDSKNIIKYSNIKHIQVYLYNYS